MLHLQASLPPVSGRQSGTGSARSSLSSVRSTSSSVKSGGAGSAMGRAQIGGDFAGNGLSPLYKLLRLSQS